MEESGAVPLAAPLSLRCPRARPYAGPVPRRRVQGLFWLGQRGGSSPGASGESSAPGSRRRLLLAGGG